MHPFLNSIQACARIEANGIWYSLLWDFNAISAAELLSGGAISFFSGLSAQYLQAMGARECRDLLRAALLSRHPSITLADAGLVLGAIGPSAAVTAICEAWILSLPEQKTIKKSDAPKLTNRELWESCWTAARFHLRLTDRQFGQLTPRQFYLLMERHRESIDLQKTLFGVVAAAAANFGARDLKRHLTPADFVGGSERTTPRQRDRIDRRERKERMRYSRSVLMRMCGR